MLRNLTLKDDDDCRLGSEVSERTEPTFGRWVSDPYPDSACCMKGNRHLKLKLSKRNALKGFETIGGPVRYYGA